MYFVFILVSWNLFVVRQLIYPIKLLVVAWHEFGHVVACACSGARLESVTIDPNGMYFVLTLVLRSRIDWWVVSLFQRVVRREWWHRFIQRLGYLQDICPLSSLGAWWFFAGLIHWLPSWVTPSAQGQVSKALWDGGPDDCCWAIWDDWLMYRVASFIIVMSLVVVFWWASGMMTRVLTLGAVGESTGRPEDKKRARRLMCGQTWMFWNRSCDWLLVHRSRRHLALLCSLCGRDERVVCDIWRDGWLWWGFLFVLFGTGPWKSLGWRVESSIGYELRLFASIFFCLKHSIRPVFRKLNPCCPVMFEERFPQVKAGGKSSFLVVDMHPFTRCHIVDPSFGAFYQILVWALIWIGLATLNFIGWILLSLTVWRETREWLKTGRGIKGKHKRDSVCRANDFREFVFLGGGGVGGGFSAWNVLSKSTVPSHLRTGHEKERSEIKTVWHQSTIHDTYHGVFFSPRDFIFFIWLVSCSSGNGRTIPLRRISLSAC